MVLKERCMDELKENLNLPVVGGEIVAYYRSQLRDGKLGIFNWEIRLMFIGPDFRYKTASTSLGEGEVQKLIQALEKVYQTMDALKNASFPGSFSKGIDSSLPWPEIEVRAENGRIWADFWLSSGTYKFSRGLSASQIEACITILKGVGDKGEKMVSILRSLISPIEK